MRFLINTVYISVLLPLLIHWTKSQADRQMEKMQDSAYDTPGAESPVPPQVLLGAMGIFGGHFLLGSGLLKQKKRVTLLSLIVGSMLGIGAFLFASGTKSAR